MSHEEIICTVGKVTVYNQSHIFNFHPPPRDHNYDYHPTDHTNIYPIHPLERQVGIGTSRHARGVVSDNVYANGSTRIMQEVLT